MEKIDTDYKQGNLKSLAKLFKPFNRDWAPLKYEFKRMFYGIGSSFLWQKEEFRGFKISEAINNN